MRNLFRHTVNEFLPYQGTWHITRTNLDIAKLLPHEAVTSNMSTDTILSAIIYNAPVNKSECSHMYLTTVNPYRSCLVRRLADGKTYEVSGPDFENYSFTGGRYRNIREAAERCLKEVKNIETHFFEHRLDNKHEVFCEAGSWTDELEQFPSFEELYTRINDYILTHPLTRQSYFYKGTVLSIQELIGASPARPHFEIAVRYIPKENFGISFGCFMDMPHWAELPEPVCTAEADGLADCAKAAYDAFRTAAEHAA